MRKADYNGYEVWEDGTIIGKRFGKPMRTEMKTDTYPQVSLQVDGTEKRFNVHRIVAELFVPNPDNKPIVNHIDGNKKNNHASNLEWVTYSENIKHAYSTGLRERGDNSEALSAHNHFTRRKIAALYATGKYSYSKLGRMFGVGQSTIYRYVKEFEKGAKRV